MTNISLPYIFIFFPQMMLIFYCFCFVYSLSVPRSFGSAFSLWPHLLALLLLNTTCPVVANSVDPDQLASEEAN